MNDSDPELCDLFSQLRSDDHRHAPAYANLLHRARHARARQSQTRSSQSWGRWATGLACAALVVIFVLAPALRPRPSLAKALPVLLKPDTVPHPIFASFTGSKPGNGSDCLLPFRLDLASL